MKLKEIAKQKGLSIKEISRQTGIDYHVLQKFSNGTRKNLSVTNAKILGKFLGFDWWLLFEEEKKEENI